MADVLDRLTSRKRDYEPKIYAYSDQHYPGLLKVGYTTRPIAARMAEHYPTDSPTGEQPYKVVFLESAIYSDGSVFMVHPVHRALKRMGVARPGGEWFRCGRKEVRAAWLAVATRSDNVERRDQNFAMRPEQAAAVAKTISYYNSPGAPASPKFLWNAKMRFGKTFAAYQLARKMGLKRVLILTFKPAVQSAWRDDLAGHIDFEDWQFISRDASDLSLDMQYENADKQRPIVCFGSFQDFLRLDPKTRGIKAKNEWVHLLDWDLVIFDEYHYGAWKDNAKRLFEEQDEEKEEDTSAAADGNAINESWLPITAARYLYLSARLFARSGRLRNTDAAWIRERAVRKAKWRILFIICQ